MLININSYVYPRISNSTKDVFDFVVSIAVPLFAPRQSPRCALAIGPVRKLAKTRTLESYYISTNFLQQTIQFLDTILPIELYNCFRIEKFISLITFH